MVIKDKRQSAVAVEALCRLVSDGFNEVPCST